MGLLRLLIGIILLTLLLIYAGSLIYAVYEVDLTIENVIAAIINYVWSD